MRIETKTEIVNICEETAEGEFVLTGETAEVTTTEIYADEGKIFRRLSDGNVLKNCKHITLGTHDDPENYEEVGKS
jgi:hypothetical protein